MKPHGRGRNKQVGMTEKNSSIGRANIIGQHGLKAHELNSGLTIHRGHPRPKLGWEAKERETVQARDGGN